MVSIRQGVFEHCHDRVSVVSGLRTDIFEDEGQSFETPCSDVELCSPVFGQNCGNAGEGYKYNASVFPRIFKPVSHTPASFSDNCDGNSATHATLTLLYTQIGEQDRQDVLRTKSLDECEHKIS